MHDNWAVSTMEMQAIAGASEHARQSSPTGLSMPWPGANRPAAVRVAGAQMTGFGANALTTVTALAATLFLPGAFAKKTWQAPRPTVFFI